jgi:hypothetical protein
VYLCGGADVLEDRDACPHRFHDHPLPIGYVDAAEEAGRRLRKGWGNPKCPLCGTYGWVEVRR